MMKNAVILFNVLLLTIGGTFFTSCENKNLPVPTKLSVSAIADTSAVLNWQSTGNYCEIKVGKKSYISNSTFYQVNGLEKNTSYTWKIRAVEGSTTFSLWVDGPEFTTID